MQTVYAVRMADAGRDTTGYDLDRAGAPAVAYLTDLAEAQELVRAICATNAVGFLEPVAVDDVAVVDTLREQLQRRRTRLERLRHAAGLVGAPR